MSTNKGLASAKEAKSSSGGGQFVKVKEDEKFEFAPLVDAEDFPWYFEHQHWDVRPAVFTPCLEEDDCPGCKVDDDGKKPRKMGYLPVVDVDKNVKILVFTSTAMDQLGVIADLFDGEIKGKVMIMSRSGKGFDTKYNVTNMGKQIEVDEFAVPDIDELVGPFDKESIEKKYIDAGFSILSPTI